MQASFWAVTLCLLATACGGGGMSRARHAFDEGRHADAVDELRALDGPHVVASHTRSHSRVSLTDPAALRDEIIGAQEDFRANLGRPVRAFAWLFGGRYGDNPTADAMVDQAGYEFLFSNLAIQKLR